MTAQPYQTLRERLVECEELLQAEVRAPPAFQVVPQCPDDRGIERCGQVVQRGELDGLPQELGVGDLRRIHPGHERTDLRENLHQAILRRQDQGGVNADNAAGFLMAGARAVCAGPEVVPPSAVAAEDWPEITRRARALTDSLRAAPPAGLRRAGTK